MEKGKRVLKSIGDSFNRNREKNRDQAYRQLQADLMAHLEILVLSGAMSMKEILSQVREVEDMFKSTDNKRVLTVQEALSDWLNGKDMEAAA